MGFSVFYRCCVEIRAMTLRRTCCLLVIESFSGIVAFGSGLSINSGIDYKYGPV